MLVEWSEFVAFLRLRIQELVATEFAQVRYGDVGMASLLAMVVALAALLTWARLVLTRRSHARQHSGHTIGRRFQRRLLARVLITSRSCCWASHSWGCWWRCPTRSTRIC